MGLSEKRRNKIMRFFFDYLLLFQYILSGKFSNLKTLVMKRIKRRANAKTKNQGRERRRRSTKDTDRKINTTRIANIVQDDNYIEGFYTIALRFCIHLMRRLSHPRYMLFC